MVFSRDIHGKLYDKREEFNFSIVNFPYLCSNLLSLPVFDVVYVLYMYVYIYIYAGACSKNDHVLVEASYL